MPIFPQDVVTYFLQQSALLHLILHLQVTEPLALQEMAEEVHQIELHQNISDLLTVRVLVLADVGVEFPYHY